MWKPKWSFFLLFIIYDGCLGVVNREYGEIHDSLRAMIFSNTSHHMPKGNPTVVKTDIRIAQIVDLNTAEQVMTVVFIMLYRWESGIFWNPDDYDGTNETFVRKSEIWSPTLSALNVVDDLGTPDVLLSDIKCVYDGWCEQSTAARLSFSCSLDLAAFPKDRQQCIVSFAPLAYTIKQVLFEPLVNAHADGSLAAYPHPELSLTNVSIISAIYPLNFHKNNSDFVQVLDLSVDLQRDPSYLISTLIIPIILVGLITAFGFLLPSDGDMKLNVQLMSLLTQAVYMSILSEKLSPTLNQPRVVVNIGMLMLLSGAGTLLALLTYNIINKSERAPPTALLKVFRIIGLVLLCGNIKIENQKVASELKEKSRINLIHISSGPTPDSEFTEISADVKLITSHIKNVVQQENVTGMWTYIALVIDRIFFVMVIVGVVIVAEVLY